jgi:hypothetical protein
MSALLAQQNESREQAEKKKETQVRDSGTKERLR